MPHRGANKYKQRFTPPSPPLALFLSINFIYSHALLNLRNCARGKDTTRETRKRLFVQFRAAPYTKIDEAHLARLTEKSDEETNWAGTFPLPIGGAGVVGRLCARQRQPPREILHPPNGPGQRGRQWPRRRGNGVQQAIPKWFFVGHPGGCHRFPRGLGKGEERCEACGPQRAPAGHCTCVFFCFSSFQ